MSSHSSYKEFLRKWAPLMVLLLLCTIISVIYPGFLSVRNFSRLLTASAGAVNDRDWRDVYHHYGFDRPVN